MMDGMVTAHARLRLVLCAVLALLSYPALRAQSELSKELQALQGTWIISSIDGKPVPATNPEVDLVIDGNNYSQVLDGKVTERGEIRLDPSKKPMAIDFFIKEGTDANKAQFGVIKMEGAAITFKLNAPAEPTRPTDFTPADGYTVFVATKKIVKTDEPTQNPEPDGLTQP